jgi:tetratricopeptide (TPR) repeat protein
MGLFSRLFTPSSAPARALPEPPVDHVFVSLEGHAALLVANFPDAKRDEYATYGLDIVLDCLALEEGRVADASPRLEARLVEHPNATWLLRDVARARLARGDLAGAHDANEAFLARVNETAPADTRWDTYQDLVRIADARGDIDEAVTTFERAIDALDEADPRPTFALGRHLRQRGRPDDAIEVMETLRGSRVPEGELFEEIGLAELARGRVEEARTMLEAVARAAACKCGSRIPQAALDALVGIYETRGEHARADELKRTLVRNGCATH